MFKGLKIRYIATLAATVGLLLTSLQPGFAAPLKQDASIIERGPLEVMDIRGSIPGESTNPGAAPNTAAPVANQKIVYNGGPVMGDPINVYLIWYGAWTDPNRLSPTSGESIINDFVNNIGPSNRNMINAAYKFGSVATGTNVVLKQQVVVPASATFGTSNGTVLGTNGVTNIVSSTIANASLPVDPNGLYFVLTAAGVSETSSAGSSFLNSYCGYHSYMTVASAPTTRLKYSFVGNPEGPSLRSCNGQAGAASPNGNPGVDAMISVLQHELEEAMTDPELNAFWDSASGTGTGNENSDICSWMFGTNISGTSAYAANMTLGNRQYYVQQNWYPGTTTSVSVPAVFSGGSCAMALPTAASVSSISPATAARGTQITVSGTNFDTATGVKIGGVTASFTRTSATSLTVTVPPTAIDGYIEVATPDGIATSNTKFTVIPMAVTGLSPEFGPEGSSVTISGSLFTGATSVTFNGAPAVFTVNSDTSISATVPAGSGSGLVTVVSPSGTVSSANNFVITTGPAPTITSLSSSSGFVGDSVTITGSNFTTTTSVTFNGVSASYTVNSDTSITALVPAGATTGLVKVTTSSGGWAYSGSNYSLNLPTISGFTPTSGFSGTVISISGTNFVGVTAVTFNGVNAASFTVNSSTGITATAPASGGTGRVAVVTASGSAVSTANFTYATPTFTSFTPATAARGATVTINGTNFTGASSVTFNGIAATSFNVVSATQITAVIPGEATTGRIVITAPGGTATSATNLTVSAPTLTSFTQAVAIGTTVNITGTNLIGVSAVTFNTTRAVTFTVVSATRITAVVPVGTTAGRLSITSPSGTVTSTGAFTLALPTVTAISPTAVSPGMTVTITGTNLLGATAVRFGTVAASTFTVNSATSISVTVPAGIVAASVFVTTPTGTNATGRAYTLALPTVTAISPTAVSPGMTVTITGTNLLGATAVRFGTVAASTFTVNSATSITVTVPAGIVAGSVTVVTGTGTSAGRAYTLALPTVTAISPTAVSPGMTVTITGTNLLGATAVRFGTVAASTFTVNSATSITVTVPAGIVAASVFVTTPTGTNSTGRAYTLALPTVASVAPTAVAVGTRITLTGTNFTGATSVRFGTVSTTAFTVNSATSITVTVPAGIVAGSVFVTTPTGTNSTGRAYTVSAVRVTSVSVTQVSAGTTVVITGTGLTSATTVRFTGVAATSTTVTATSITVVAPANVTAGSITFVIGAVTYTLPPYTVI